MSARVIRIIVIVIVVLGAAGAYIAYDMLNAQRKADTISASTTDTALTPGTWEDTSQAPEENALQGDALSQYQVAADQPRALYIQKLGIAARIKPMDKTADGAIQTPRNIYDAGWYTRSAKPGQPGVTFIDGHASGATRQGLMAYVDTLRKGDVIDVEKGNAEKLTYKVVHVETVPLDSVDMQKALSVYGDAQKGLTIMTCTGIWIPEKLTYDKRAIVYAQQIEA